MLIGMWVNKGHTNVWKLDLNLGSAGTRTSMPFFLSTFGIFEDLPSSLKTFGRGGLVLTYKLRHFSWWSCFTWVQPQNWCTMAMSSVSLMHLDVFKEEHGTDSNYWWWALLTRQEAEAVWEWKTLMQTTRTATQETQIQVTTQTGLWRERRGRLKKAKTTGCNSFMQMRTAKLWGTG